MNDFIINRMDIEEDGEYTNERLQRPSLAGIVRVWAGRLSVFHLNHIIR